MVPNRNRPPPRVPQGAPGQKVVVVELFQDVFLQTDGTTGLVYTDIDCSEWEHLGPYVESAYVLSSTVNRTSDHQWGVYVSWTNSGRTWANPALATGSLITSNGDQIHSMYSTVTNFGGLRMRAAAGCRNGSAGSRESAQCSAWLVLVLRT